MGLKKPSKIQKTPEAIKIPDIKPSKTKGPRSLPKAVKEEVAENAGLKNHPGDIAAQDKAVKKAPKPKRKKGPLPQLDVNLYVLGRESRGLHIHGPSSVMDKFDRYCKKHELKKWEALALLLDDLAPKPKRAASEPSTKTS